MSKRIIDKIKINQAIVKDKNKTPTQRRAAYLELKRLNSLKNPGNILKRLNREMWNVNSKYDDTIVHHYLVTDFDKNYVKVNLITHSKKIKPRYKIEELSTKDKPSYLIKKPRETDFKKRKLKFYDFFESKLNNELSIDIKNKLIKVVNDYLKHKK